MQDLAWEGADSRAPVEADAVFDVTAPRDRIQRDLVVDDEKLPLRTRVLIILVLAVSSWGLFGLLAMWLIRLAGL